MTQDRTPTAAQAQPCPLPQAPGAGPGQAPTPTPTAVQPQPDHWPHTQAPTPTAASTGAPGQPHPTAAHAPQASAQLPTQHPAQAPTPTPTAAPARTQATALPPTLPAGVSDIPADTTPAEVAAAMLLAEAYRPGGKVSLPAALKTLRAGVAALDYPDGTLALSELKRQLPVLEAMWFRFSQDAMAATRPETRSVLTRTALQAQQAYSRTFALVQALTPARDGKGSRVTLDMGGRDGG